MDVPTWQEGDQSGEPGGGGAVGEGGGEKGTCTSLKQRRECSETGQFRVEGSL